MEPGYVPSPAASPCRSPSRLPATPHTRPTLRSSTTSNGGGGHTPQSAVGSGAYCCFSLESPAWSHKKTCYSTTQQQLTSRPNLCLPCRHPWQTHSKGTTHHTRAHNTSITRCHQGRAPRPKGGVGYLLRSMTAANTDALQYYQYVVVVVVVVRHYLGRDKL